MRKRLRATSPAVLALAAAVFLAAASGDALACPNCKEAVEDKSALGFGYAIYVMLASVFSLAGGVVWMIVRTARRAAAAEDAGAGLAPGGESETQV